MSYYLIARNIRYTSLSNRLECFYRRRNGVKLINVGANAKYNLRSYCVFPKLEGKPTFLKYVEIKSQINSLLEDKTKPKNENISIALQYCGQSSPNLTITQRRALSHEIWESIRNYEDAYCCHAYIQACIDNEQCVNYIELLDTIKFKPSLVTYKLLLESACNIGSKNAAVNILELMKKDNHPADIDVFNLLVLGYTINGGSDEAKSILEMMKLSRVKSTEITNWNLIRGVATFNNGSEFLENLEKYALVFKDELYLDVLHRLGLHETPENLKKFIYKIGPSAVPRHLKKNITDVSIQLVLRERPTNAFEIYTSLVETEDNYGIVLLEHMLQSGTPIDIIISLTKQLETLNLNPIALQSITQLALENGYFDNILTIFNAMGTLKPHYFWPLLNFKAKDSGQIGVFETVKTMQELNVLIDADTLYFYIIPNCDLSDPKLLINTLKSLNFTVKDILTPILAVLLIRNEVSTFTEICKFYDVAVDGQKLLKPVINFYKKARNFDTTLLILQRICETNPVTTDWTGLFLLQVLKGPKNNSDFQDYSTLLRIIKSAKLTITRSSFDNILNYLQGRSRIGTISDDIINGLDNLVDQTKQETDYIQHPRDMDLKQLECHLIELTEKQMETRGVLRRLIQEHSRLGNHTRLIELREIYKNSGYTETAGMKGSIMNSFIVMDKLESALLAYNEIKTEFSNFKVDLFKIIDLATLLVKNGQFDKAVAFLNQESVNNRYVASPKIERNCWRLLSSCQTFEQVDTLFKFLIDNNMCNITNVILGPMVKVHLNNDNLAAAVSMYKQCAQKYRYTPLQLELLTKIVENEIGQEFLHDVLKVTASIHGNGPARMSLIAALAENGYEKPLTKFILENEAIPSKLMQQRCDRWVTENKLSALLTLLKSIERLPVNIADKTIVQNAILRLHGSKQDCDSALEFYNQLKRKDVEVNSEFNQTLIALLKRCNYNIPDSLSM